MCYDRNKWNDARDAIIKSSMAVPKYCLDPKNPKQKIDEVIDNFELGKRPEKIEYPMQPGKYFEVNNDNLVYDFALTEKVDCYLQFFVKCKKLYRTAGIGDTISSTGFIYHVPKL